MMDRTRRPDLKDRLARLMEKGVRIPNPGAVEIGESVSIDRISGNGVCLHGGTRIEGATTLIGSGVILGSEAPVTVADCQIGPNVRLNGGSFHSSVFLAGATMGSGAQVREGCLLEEQSSGAHTVGLKQTILFPFVTLGSLINFCDCLMTGGTSRKNHSEVGSSYIHFNYTPHQDKATPSLIGDVPTGVMLNRPPIFLGGQGGLVGPVRIGHGTVIAAGTICRTDCPEGGKAPEATEQRASGKAFQTGCYGDITRRIRNNVLYISSLLALSQWYRHIRQPFFRLQDQGPALYQGAMAVLDMAIEERLKRFRELSEKMAPSIELGEKLAAAPDREVHLRQQRDFLKNWSAIEDCLRGNCEADADNGNRDAFTETVKQQFRLGQVDYIQTIQGLDAASAAVGALWLKGIINRLTDRVLEIIPSCKG